MRKFNNARNHVKIVNGEFALNPIEQLTCLGAIYRTLIRNWFKLKFEPETQLLNRWLKEGSVCLDIGAGYGRYAYVLSQLVQGSGQVHSFEPLDYNLAVLRAIVQFHRLNNVTIVPKALSRQSGTQNLVLPIKKKSGILPAMAHSLAHLATDSESNGVKKTVPVTTVDQYASERQLNRIDFIKCDVEGAELLVFEGGKNVLNRDKPVVLCEAYEAWLKRFGRKREDLLRFFSQLHYQAFALNGKELIRIKELREDGNYFFIPVSNSK